ncbi:MAG: hypothetical protein ACQEVA_22645 [Myxococcota bacterium]
MNYHLFVVSLACALGLAACATGPDKPIDASGSAMLGLTEEPKHPVWDKWTPAPTQSVPVNMLEPLEAFDYWQLDQSDYVESTWAAISTLVDSARRQSDDEGVGDAATLMLEALEPGKASTLVVDATFYVTADREGVAVRFSRRLDPDGTASLVLLLDRSADGEPEADRIRLLATPGFEEPTAFRVDLRRDGGNWRARLVSASAGVDEASGTKLDEAALYASVLLAQTWKPLTGAEYASARLRAEEASELPPPFRPALGLGVDDRDIARVFTNSVFTPRMDEFDPES